MMTQPESRLCSLARPKRIPVGFIDDSRSVYWNNNISKVGGANFRFLYFFYVCLRVLVKFAVHGGYFSRPFGP